MIEIQNLTKRYGQKLAVDDVSFHVDRGEILGFLGPNGAGKSTTMNILTGYLSATSGECKINGVDILEDPIRAKRSIGYLPEQPPLYLDMTVKEYLSFIYDLKKAKQPKTEHIKEVCDVVKISNVYNRLIKNLSKGYKQRVGVAQALIGKPDLLILDEPTVGLDPKQIIEIRNLVKKLGENHTVILSSHILSEIQAVCDRVIIINQGHIVADEMTNNLSNAISTDNKILLEALGDKEKIVEAVRSLERVKKVEILSDEIEDLLRQCLELRDKKQCKVCYVEMDKEYKYCPNCGAKQDDNETIKDESYEEVEEDDNKEEHTEEKDNNLEKTVKIESNVENSDEINDEDNDKE